MCNQMITFNQLIAIFTLNDGINFLGVLILLGIAVGMTSVILWYKDEDQEDTSELREEITVLKESMKQLHEKLDELKKLLEE